MLKLKKTGQAHPDGNLFLLLPLAAFCCLFLISGICGALNGRDVVGAREGGRKGTGGTVEPLSTGAWARGWERRTGRLPITVFFLGYMKHKRLLGGRNMAGPSGSMQQPAELQACCVLAALEVLWELKWAAEEVCGAKQSTTSMSPWCCLASHRGICWVFCAHMEQGREVWWWLKLQDMNI